MIFYLVGVLGRPSSRCLGRPNRCVWAGLVGSWAGLVGVSSRPNIAQDGHGRSLAELIEQASGEGQEVPRWEAWDMLGSEAGGVYSCHSWPQSYDHRPSYPYNI